MVMLTILWVCFIFGNSSEVAEVSSQKSGAIAGWFSGIITERTIRKMAHLFEYGVLGILLSADVTAFLHINKKGIFTALSIGLIIAVVDEMIQLTADGRSAQISDVCIDFVGVVLGTTTILVIINFLNKIKSNSKI